MTTFPPITDEVNDTASAGTFRGPGRLAPLTLAKWIMSDTALASGDNDAQSIIDALLQRHVDENSIESFASLPNAQDHKDDRVIYVRDLGFFRNTDAGTATGRFVTETVRTKTATGHIYDYGFDITNPNAGFFGVSAGRAISNPDDRVQLFGLRREGADDTSAFKFSLGLKPSQFVAARGRVAQSGDTLDLVITDASNASLTDTISVSFIDEISASGVHIATHFRSGDVTGDKLASLEGLLDGNTVDVHIYNQGTTTHLFTSSESWTNINSEVFKELLDRLKDDEDFTAYLHEYLPLKDLDELPTDISEYQEDRIVAVNGYLSKKSTTKEDTFEGAVGSREFKGITYKGFSSRNADTGVKTIGQFIANPNNTLSEFLVNDNGQLHIGIRQDLYETAKGSAFNRQADRISVTATYSGEQGSDTAVFQFQAFYRGDEDSKQYIWWRSTHPDFADDGSNFVLWGVDEGTRAEVIVSKTDGTHLFTHPANLEHWLGYDFANERHNEDLIEENERNIEALQHSANDAKGRAAVGTPDGDIAVVSVLPNPNDAGRAVALVPVLPGDANEKSRIRYVSKTGGSEWSGWTFKHEFDATATADNSAFPTGAVQLVGNHAGDGSIFTLAVDGAGDMSLTRGQRFTIGSGSTVYTIAAFKPNPLGATRLIDIFGTLQEAGADNATLNFVGAKVKATVDTANKTVTIGFAADNLPVIALSTAIERLADFPTDDWYVDPLHFANFEVVITSSMMEQSGVSEYGHDAPEDGAYVLMEEVLKDFAPGGYPISSMPGLYQLVDIPSDLPPDRFRARLENRGGWHGFFTAGAFPELGFGPSFNLGEMVFDTSNGRIVGLVSRPSGGLEDYQLFVAEDMFYSAMTDRVKRVWLELEHDDHRKRADELGTGVTPVVIDPVRFDPSVVIHDNLVCNAYAEDGTRVMNNWSFNVTGDFITISGKKFRIFEALGGTNADPLIAAANQGYVDFDFVLDVDHAFSLVRDESYPVPEDLWADNGLRSTGTPGLSARTKCWRPHDTFEPAVSDLNVIVNGLRNRQSALATRITALEDRHNEKTLIASMTGAADLSSRAWTIDDAVSSLITNHNRTGTGTDAIRIPAIDYEDWNDGYNAVMIETVRNSKVVTAVKILFSQFQRSATPSAHNGGMWQNTDNDQYQIDAHCSRTGSHLHMYLIVHGTHDSATNINVYLVS